jgi:hypothetical protein
MRSVDSDRGRTARSQPNFNRREYQAARPTDDQVRNFLNRGQGGASRQAQDLRGRAGDVNRGDRDFGRAGDFNRRNLGDARDTLRDRDAGRVGGRAGDLTDRTRRDLSGRDLTGRGGDNARRDLQDRIGDANRRGDRDLTGRGGDNTRRDLQDRIGDANRRGDRDFNRGDRDFNRDGRERRIARRDGGRDGDYRRWRDGAWSGDRDGDRRGDNRDWSGRWRDGDRFDKAWQVRDNWRNRWGDSWHDHDHDWHDFPFHVGWWGGNHWHGNHWDFWDNHHHGDDWFWWSWVAAPLLFDHFHYGWNTPYYWDYGPGEYIYYDDGFVYVNGAQYQPAPVFYDNTVELIEEAPVLTEVQAAEAEWLPLGVFAVTRQGQAESDLLVQLAVTQEGIIGGTVSDQASGVTYQLEGTVEKETQRAVWSYTNDRNQRILMETSVFNLTQPEATGLVHYGPEDIQVIEMVRLEAPEGAGVAVEGELPAPPPQ